MTTWKLSIKPDNTEGFDPFKFCKDKSLLGVGWAGAYKEKQATNISEAKALMKIEYNEWPYPIKYLLEDVKSGDHIWLHQNGNYFLCQASDEIKLGAAIDKDFMNYDLGHARKAKWVTVPEIYVSKGGRWFQNDLITQYKGDSLFVCQESQDLMHPVPYIMLWTPMNRDFRCAPTVSLME